ncbi:hypothetical protein HY285_01675 [Candidatus Peregrinibacteria bacterium]|nr:hypothetical protein [Candidatus Peregrinibacteria bacterium]MBI3816237.1 hypothetical protein [Candidatus Peregrinibacteria bacterium]
MQNCKSLKGEDRAQCVKNRNDARKAACKDKKGKEKAACMKMFNKPTMMKKNAETKMRSGKMKEKVGEELEKHGQTMMQNGHENAGEKMMKRGETMMEKGAEKEANGQKMMEKDSTKTQKHRGGGGY